MMAGGFNITITNDLLVLPELKVGEHDGAIHYDPSKLDVMIYPNPDLTQIPYLGRQFFAAAYLFVDRDAEEFSIWEAKSTTDTNLIAVGDTCADKAPTSTAPSGSNSKTNGLSAEISQV